jgi:dTDP-4-dehydrorhamnose reductase
MERKIALVGNGYIGSKLSLALGQHFEVEVLSRNITSNQTILTDALSRFDFVINAAGYAGETNIDDCEKEVVTTVESNFDLARRIALASHDTKIRMIQLSTGCVFEGDELCEFKEEDEPNLLNGVYRQTKALAESFVMTKAYRPIVARIRLPFDDRHHSRNLFTKLSAYPVLVNHKNSVTSVDDLADTVVQMCADFDFASDVYHVTNPHFVSTREIAEALKLDCDWMSDDKLNSIVKIRRSRCVLNTKKLYNAGVVIPFAPYAVAKCAEIYRGEQ